jgi:hypothetical protein
MMLLKYRPDGVLARHSAGINLVRSGGRSRRGSAPNYILIVYSSCNPRVRAWSDEEAIEAANQKRERLRKQSKVPPIELPEGAEER